MPNLPKEALLPDKELPQFCYSAWENPSKETWHTAIEVRNAASEHTWAYLEPVLRGLMEAAEAREAYEYSMPNPFGHDCQ